MFTDEPYTNAVLGHSERKAAEINLEERFARAWQEAPKSARRFTERDSAEFFYLLGVRDGRDSTAVDLNEDLKEMARLVRERITR